MKTLAQEVENLMRGEVLQRIVELRRIDCTTERLRLYLIAFGGINGLGAPVGYTP